MSTVAIFPAELKPAVPPLISRCFARCYSAVRTLFSFPVQEQETRMNQLLIEVAAPLPEIAEQRPADEAAIEPVAPRGRPWVKGQSGNPRGRPSRARQAAYVAEALIQRKTVPLTDKLIELALAGDRTALRLCLDRIAPARREPPIDLDLPRINNRADLLVALTAIADAAASGALTSSQSATLTQMLVALRQSAW